MTNQNQELLFIFAGVTYAGALLLALAVFAGVRKLRTPKPKDYKKVLFDARAVEQRVIKSLSSHTEEEWDDLLKRWGY